MVYSGQLDVIIAFPQTEAFLNALEWSGKYIYSTAPRQIWKVNDDVAGYVRVAKNLIQVMVRNAGHILPFDQPKWAFDMIQRFIQEKAFAWDFYLPERWLFLHLFLHYVLKAECGLLCNV